MQTIRKAATAFAAALAASTAGAAPQAVTPASFARAETHGYIASVIARGGMGRFAHLRELAAADRPLVVRPNRDTLYSTAVFDLAAGPVTIRLPKAGSRYFSMMVMNEDHFIPAIYHGAGRYRIDRAGVGTRYALVGLRIFVDPARPGDMAAVHALQDAVTVDQPRGPGRFESPGWDPASQAKVRSALLALGETLPNLDQAFGKASQVDPVAHLVGAAMAWGGLPRTEATYLNVTPTRNDGTAIYRLTVGKVPVDAFWSVTVYDREGRLIPDPRQRHSLNTLTARYGADGTATVQFGGCGQAQDNCLPVAPGWNYMVRMYRPRAQVLDGRWIFPAATPVEN